MNLVLIAIASAAVAAVLWRASEAMFAAPVLQRRNYRGVDVPVGAGILLVIAMVVVEAGLALWEVFLDRPDDEGAMRLIFLLVGAFFCLLGLFDDLAAHGEDRGFRGHLASMARGRLTTGGLKLVAGGLIAIVVSATLSPSSPGAVVVGALVIALAANLGNLFDRAPGRTTKVGVVTGLVVLGCASGADRPSLAGLAMVVGAAAGLLLFDLREELMLGDAGSNVLGAAVGLGLVATTSLAVQGAVLVVLVALNLLSERVSFSSIIESTPPLRWFDRLGRRGEGR